MKKLILLTVLLPGALFSQCKVQFDPILGKLTCPNTVNATGSGVPGGSAGQIQFQINGTTFGGFSPGGDVTAFSQPNFTIGKIGGVAIPTSGVLKGASGPSIVQAVSGTDFAPATSGSSILKGSSGGFAAALAADVVGIFSGCSGVLLLGADGACHAATAGGGVNAQTVSYSLLSGDSGKIVTFNGSSLTATLPNPVPSASWASAIKNLNASALIVSRNSLTINGGTSNITLLQFQETACFSDGTNYICSVPYTAGTNVTLTPSSVGISISSSGGGGSGSVVLTSGSGAPSAACLQPSSSNLAVYFDSTARNIYYCNQTSGPVWRQFLDDGTGSGKTGYTAWGGVTSGAEGFTVNDIAGTSILYILPTSNGISGQVLSDSGVATCPTVASGAPGTCHQLVWIASGGGGVNAQTSSYTLVSGDAGKTVTLNGSSLTASLPAASPSATWAADIKNLNASALTVSRNGLLINGGTSNIVLQQFQDTTCFSDGTNYVCTVPVVAGTNITLTPASNGLTLASSTASNVVLASSPGLGIAHFAGSTQSVTSSLIVAADITSGTITATQLAPTDFTVGTTKTFSLNSGIFECSGTCTITLPAPVAGRQYCVRNANNISTVITFAAIGSSAMYENQASTGYGTAGTGTFVSGGTVLDRACLIGKDSTHYDLYSSSGTWTAN